MKHRIDKTLILSSLVCLLPIVLSIAVYDKLPASIPIHWSSPGVADRYASKAVASFGLPVLMLLLNLFVHFRINSDPKRVYASSALQVFSKWVIPVLSLILVPVSLFISMGVNIQIHIIAPVLVGLLFIVVGNYLPKCKQNYTIGIRLPWTLHDADNWQRTHRFAGFVWVLGGLVMIISSFLDAWHVEFAIIAALIIAPIAYSYSLYRAKTHT